MLEETIFKRLALIKHLYNNGLTQADSDDYTASFAILSFHDSVEMFLKLVAEKKNVNSSKFNFIQYWDKIPELTLKESFRQLNARRVNLKHKGILPSKIDVEVSKSTVLNFFEQNSVVQFGIEWTKVSRASTITNNELRGFILEAERCIGKANFRSAIENLAIGFHLAIRLYEENKIDFIGHSPFEFDRHSNSLDVYKGLFQKRSITSLASKTAENLDTIYSTLKIISLGIDYKKYIKFKLLTPIVTYMSGSDKPVLELVRRPKWNKKNVSFCLNFVIEVIHILQVFDFEINQILNDTEFILEISDDSNNSSSSPTQS